MAQEPTDAPLNVDASDAICTGNEPNSESALFCTIFLIRYEKYVGGQLRITDVSLELSAMVSL